MGPKHGKPAKNQKNVKESIPAPLSRNVAPVVHDTSGLYKACRFGEVEAVRKLLPKLSIGEINRMEANGSTALHAACYYGHYEIVKMLLEAGACRSIRNKRYNKTPYEETSSEEIRVLFYRVQNQNGTDAAKEIKDRFTGMSKHPEWVLESKQAAAWKIDLYKWLKFDNTFDEMLQLLAGFYLLDHVIPACSSEMDKQSIMWFFHQAVLHKDVQYILKAYTSTTEFYSIVNLHLAEFLLKFFRSEVDTHNPNTLERSTAYLASLFIYNPDLHALDFTGVTYRGMILNQQDLAMYSVGKRLLNKTLLSTSINRQVAEQFAGVQNSLPTRRKLNGESMQYMTLCIYKIMTPGTAVDISAISEVPEEEEVLIMPLCAFQIRSVKENNDGINKIDIEIELEECPISKYEDVQPAKQTTTSIALARVLS